MTAAASDQRYRHRPAHRRRSRRLLPARAVLPGLVVVLLALVDLLLPAPTTPDVKPVPAGWTDLWRDDFSGPADRPPDPGTWLVDLGHNYPGDPPGWGNGELEAYTGDPANLATDGAGNLRITAVRDGSGAWTSARIETRRADFRPADGRELKIEARIRLPDGGTGYWPAFWALGVPIRKDHLAWPASGEIDVFENIDGRPEIHGALHCLRGNGGACDSAGGATAVTPVTPGMHTYAVVWQATSLTWYLDDQPYHSVTEDEVGADAWNRALDHGYFLLLNVAIGGSWPGEPDASTESGASMLVDYVAVAERTAMPAPTE